MLIVNAANSTSHFPPSLRCYPFMPTATGVSLTANIYHTKQALKESLPSRRPPNGPAADYVFLFRNVAGSGSFRPPLYLSRCILFWEPLSDIHDFKRKTARAARIRYNWLVQYFIAQSSRREHDYPSTVPRGRSLGKQKKKSFTRGAYAKPL